MEYEQLKIFRMEQLEGKHVKFGEYNEFERFAAVPKGDKSNCSVYFYRLPPGKANFPYHYHEKNEEIFYIISGSGIVLSEEGEKKISAGDMIVCPPTPGGAHKIANPSKTDDLVYVEFDTVSYPDLAHYPLRGIVGIIRSDSEGNEFYRESERVDYEREVERPVRDWGNGA